MNSLFVQGEEFIGHESDVLASMIDLLESARRASARAVNSVMTATYWEIVLRIDL